jgi:hypothetical protein
VSKNRRDAVEKLVPESPHKLERMPIVERWAGSEKVGPAQIVAREKWRAHKKKTFGANHGVTDPIPRLNFNIVVIAVICRHVHRRPIIVAAFDLGGPSREARRK